MQQIEESRKLDLSFPSFGVNPRRFGKLELIIIETAFPNF